MSSLTIQEIKDKLPDVTVILDGVRVRCRLAGRFNQFATVYTLGGLTVGEYAWSTIQSHLSSGRPLRA